MFNLPLLKPSLLTTAASHPFNPITNGLVLWYKFGEGSGDTTYDSSGNADNGTLTTSGTQLPIWSSGVPSSPVSSFSLLFDGETNEVLATSSSVISSTPLTMMAWINPSSGIETILQRLFNVNTNISLLYENGGGDENTLGLFNTNNHSINTDAIAHYSDWQHIAATYDTTTSASIYYNGVLQTSGVVGGTFPVTGSTSVGCEAFGGYISDARLYNRVLSSTEISEIYNLTG